jgi:hypothetical protein
MPNTFCRFAVENCRYFLPCFFSQDDMQTSDNGYLFFGGWGTNTTKESEMLQKYVVSESNDVRF